MRAQGLAQALLGKLATLAPSPIADQAAWQATLEHLAITKERHGASPPRGRCPVR